MFGVGIWVIIQEIEYKYLVGNKASLIYYFYVVGKRNKIWVKYQDLQEQFGYDCIWGIRERVN